MKTKIILVSFAILLIALTTIVLFKTDNKSLNNSENKPFSTGDIDDPQARIEQEHKMLRDIKTNKLPENILILNRYQYV